MLVYFHVKLDLDLPKNQMVHVKHTNSQKEKHKQKQQNMARESFTCTMYHIHMGFAWFTFTSLNFSVLSTALEIIKWRPIHLGLNTVNNTDRVKFIAQPFNFTELSASHPTANINDLTSGRTYSHIDSHPRVLYNNWVTAKHDNYSLHGIKIIQTVITHGLGLGIQ